MIDTRKFLNQFKIMLVVALLTLIGQKIGYNIPVQNAIPGMIIIIIIGMVALYIKDTFPNIKFPAFAWASLLALILTIPSMPTSKFILGYVKYVSFLGTTTPILAFAGISIGMKIMRLKELSWKLVLVAFAAFVGTFFGSAIIAQIVLKIQGII